MVIRVADMRAWRANQTMKISNENPPMSVSISEQSKSTGFDTDYSVATLTVDVPDPCMVWGVPFTPVSFDETVELIDHQVRSRIPGYFITANLHYIMLTDRHPKLKKVNRDAAFVIADGMPIVWRSRLSPRPIPERVAGSDLIYAISELSAKRGYRVFFLGGEPGIAKSAARILEEKYPNLQVVGIEVPPFRELLTDEESAIINRIKAARPDILLAALGQPAGEIWLHRWYRELELPLGVQLGGSFNFVTGKISRSPDWVAKSGLEWFYRFYREPRRLGPRYFRNGLFLAKALLRDVFGIQPRSE